VPSTSPTPFSPWFVALAYRPNEQWKQSLEGRDHLFLAPAPAERYPRQFSGVYLIP
jgi:hypothetical protein